MGNARNPRLSEEARFVTTSIYTALTADDPVAGRYPRRPVIGKAPPTEARVAPFEFAGVPFKFDTLSVQFCSDLAQPRRQYWDDEKTGRFLQIASERLPAPGRTGAKPTR
jgi:hypothetical protein